VEFGAHPLEICQVTLDLMLKKKKLHLHQMSLAFYQLNISLDLLHASRLA
jgi:hypothetical protein